MGLRQPKGVAPAVPKLLGASAIADRYSEPFCDSKQSFKFTLLQLRPSNQVQALERAPYNQIGANGRSL